MSHHTLLLLMMLPAVGCINVQDQIDLDGDTGTPRPDDTDDQDTEDPVDTVDTQDAETPIPFCINEIMADNRGALRLSGGETPDWFELHNPTADELRLVGWQVSDTQNPELWASLDEIVLAPEAFVVLYADGAGVPGPRHLNFELSSEGDSGPAVPGDPTSAAQREQSARKGPLQGLSIRHISTAQRDTSRNPDNSEGT
jgi:hypothetical protein